MIITLAGRRVDAANAESPRFPLENTALVRSRIREVFEHFDARALVCAAACGADLIALSEAGALGLRRRIILPFDRKRFRETSVIDRPGNWGPLYDQVLDQVAATNDLLIKENASEEEGYAAANLAILEESLALARQFDEPVTAVLVWDGRSRGDHDLTEEFGTEARKRGLPVVEVSTM